MPGPYDIAVVGMGPVGLAAAYEAAKNGNKVLILEKRTEAQASVRPQVVVLDPARKQQLIQMIHPEYDRLNTDDMKFLDSIASSAEVKLRDVQSFILNRIKSLNKNNPGLVEMQYSTELASVDLEKGSAVSKTEDKETPIQFKHLIAADGAASKTLELVNSTLSEQQKIKRETPSNMQHLENTFHLGAYIKLSRADKKDLVLPEREFVSSFLENKRPDKKKKSNQLYFLRFDKKSYEKTDKKSVKLGFIGEVPKDVYDKYQEYVSQINVREKALNNIKSLNPDPNNIALQDLIKQHTTERNALITEKNNFALQYVKKAAADYLDMKEEELAIEITNSKRTPEKDKLKVLAFRGGSKQAEKAATEINGHGFYLVGDAYFTPNYPVGHGLNDGLQASGKLGSIPRDNDKTNFAAHMTEYNQLTAANAGFARKMMQGIRWFRKLGDMRLKVANFLEWAVDKRERSFKIDLKENLSHTLQSNQDRLQDSLREELFSPSYMHHLFGFGGANYNVGLLSLSNLKDPLNQLTDLRKISNDNQGVPILIRVPNNKGDYDYHLYSQNKTGDWELKNLSVDKGLLGKIDQLKIDQKFPKTENELSILPTKESDQIIGKLFFATKPPLHYQSPDNDIIAKIKSWDKLLNEIPTIVKQYRNDITNTLEVIKGQIEQEGSSSVKKEFNNFYVKYQAAIAIHDKNIIEMALKNPNKPDASGRTPLAHALRYENPATIEKVLEAGAKIDNNAIFTKRMQDNFEVANILFRHGANPFKPLSKNSPVSMLAASLNPADDHFNPIFGLKCIITAKDKESSLHKQIRADLSVSEIDRLLGKFNDYSFISKIQDVGEDKLREIIKSLDPTAKDLGKYGKTVLVDKLLNIAEDVLKDVKRDKQLTQSSKSNLSHTVNSFFHRTPANDSKIAEKVEYKAKLK